MNDYSQKDLTLRDLLRVIFRHKLIIIACFVTIMIAVYIGLELKTPLYRSTVRMLVSGTMQKDLEMVRSLGPGSLVLTQMSLVLSKPILERTVEALKLYQRPLDYGKSNATRLKKILIDRDVRAIEQSLESMTPEAKQSFLMNKAMGELSGQINTYPETETSIFVISVTDFNPSVAGIIANVVSRSYVIFDLEQQIAELQLTYGNKNETIVKLVKHIEELEETLDGRILPDIEALGPATVKIINQAGFGVKMPIRPSKANALIAAFIMCMVIGVTLAFLFDFFDQTFKSPDEVEKVLNIQSLGSIPKRKVGTELLNGHSHPSTRYDHLVQNVSNGIYLSMKDQNLKTLLLTDAEGSEETPVIMAEIGICLARKSGYRVLIIDANFRTPSLHKIFKISDTSGLIDVIAGKMHFEHAVSDLGLNLTVMPAGNTESFSIAMLESAEMSDVINKAKNFYDITLIHCAQMKEFSDAIILSSVTDSMALVINGGQVRRQIVKSAIDPLKQRNVKIIGAILNNHKYVIPEIIYRLT